MLFAILFGALVSTLIQGTQNYPACKEIDFKHKACSVSEAMDNAGK
jgi:hypothetical protein